VFHALLHVADCLEWLGPMWSYAQWFTERMFALWTPKVCYFRLYFLCDPPFACADMSSQVKLKSRPSRNLSLVLLHNAQISAIRFSADLTPPDDVQGITVSPYLGLILRMKRKQSLIPSSQTSLEDLPVSKVSQTPTLRISPAGYVQLKIIKLHCMTMCLGF
jgi:hypothetical protein